MPDRRYPNPDLAVGADNKQRWNQPAHRRQGFHKAHRLFRRALMVRARDVRALNPVEEDRLSLVPALRELIEHPAFSALCCVQDDQIMIESAASDFAATRPHSIQSVTKLHMHLIIGWLLDQGLIALDRTVAHYLPFMGEGYADATVQSLLDMAVTNDFTEDYADPLSDCYAEEVALGWRLPDENAPELTLKEFAKSITGFKTGTLEEAQYKSANTDVLTLIAAAVSPVPLFHHIETIADAAGYEGAFYISQSKDGHPAFSGGGCLSARDLARFGLLFTDDAAGQNRRFQTNVDFLRDSLQRSALPLRPPKNWLRYSNHLMTDGQLVGHAGYGGQFLMVNPKTKVSCAYLSVLENASGYDDDYMAFVADTLRQVCLSF